jgi:hypothetical protein
MREAVAAYKQVIALAPDQNSAPVRRIQRHVSKLESALAAS